MNLGWRIVINKKVAELASNIIKDGMEDIDLNHIRFTNQGIKTIEKIAKFTNPVINFIFIKTLINMFNWNYNIIIKKARLL